MRIIATVLVIATALSMPMAFSASATNEVKNQAAVNQAVEAETSDLQVKEEVKEKLVEETVTQAIETVEQNAEEEIVYKEIVKAKPIDTSKPHLQSAVGTTPTSTTPTNYPLTASERDLIERVVMAEIGGGTYNDKIAVAQCIYDRIIHYRMSVEQVIYQRNAFTDPYKKTVSQSVKDAVEDVFTNGKRITVEPIFYFIASRSATSGCFHETQKCVYITDAHRYYTSKRYA